MGLNSLISRVMDNPVESIGALARYGFKFSGAQKEMIKNFTKTNQLAEAQKIILQSIENVFGGTHKEMVWT
jgi:hypothetical protein